jgi:hypothetical protein
MWVDPLLFVVLVTLKSEGFCQCIREERALLAVTMRSCHSLYSPLQRAILSSEHAKSKVNRLTYKHRTHYI